FTFVVLFKIEHGGCSYLCSRFEALIGRADGKHSQRATYQRENDRVNADWAGAQHEHGVTNRNFTAFDCMQRGGQGATANHESFGVRVETDAARAWLEINLFGPTAAQPIIEPIGDAVNFSLRTTSCGFRHETIPTGVARAMHIEKGDAIAFAKRATVY